MNLSNKQFDGLRTIVEIIGYVGTFILAVSEEVGYEHGAQMAAIFSALMICLGSCVNALRNGYIEPEDEKKKHELD